METDLRRYRLPIIFLSVFVALWGILGILDSKNYSYAGYDTDGNKTIIEIEKGSPAEAAGLQVGDYMLSIDGTGMDDTKSWERKPRTIVGQTRKFLVQRNGEEVEIDITNGALVGKRKTLNNVAFFLGIIFLLCGLWIFQKSKSLAGVSFSLYAIFFASAFFNGPYFTSLPVREFFSFLDFTFVLAAFAMLVYFLLNFPDRRSTLDKKNAVYFVVGPAFLLATTSLVIEILDPDATSGLRTFLRVFFGSVILYYFGWALLTLFKHYRSNSSEERQNKGINLLMVGAFIGLIPILIVIIINTVAPHIVIPGDDYAFITLGFIPIFFAFAINRKEGF